MALRCSEWVAGLFPSATCSVGSARKQSPAYQHGQPIQHGGRLSLERQTFVNAGLRPQPSAAVGVDKGSPLQPCSPPSVRRQGMAACPDGESPPTQPNSEEAVIVVVGEVLPNRHQCDIAYKECREDRGPRLRRAIRRVAEQGGCFFRSAGPSGSTTGRRPRPSQSRPPRSGRPSASSAPTLLRLCLLVDAISDVFLAAMRTLPLPSAVAFNTRRARLRRRPWTSAVVLGGRIRPARGCAPASRSNA